MNITKKQINDLSYRIMGAAIEVHKHLGPGLLESVYENCLEWELKQAGLHVSRQQLVPIRYKSNELNAALRYDMLVENLIVLELKTVDYLLPVHEAQLMTYLRLLEKPKGILLNFFCQNLFKEGQKTFVTEIFRSLPDD
ncbi:MAG: GxxExxY protein [Haliscomenobacteraceae bacterium CHB4]|nr:GxxExxY protein [Haliscomenobacteraceae bacterium CHB4]